MESLREKSLREIAIDVYLKVQKSESEREKIILSFDWDYQAFYYLYRKCGNKVNFLKQLFSSLNEHILKNLEEYLVENTGELKIVKYWLTELNEFLMFVLAEHEGLNNEEKEEAVLFVVEEELKGIDDVLKIVKREMLSSIEVINLNSDCIIKEILFEYLYSVIYISSKNYDKFGSELKNKLKKFILKSLKIANELGFHETFETILPDEIKRYDHNVSLNFDTSKKEKNKLSPTPVLSAMLKSLLNVEYGFIGV